MYKLSDDDEYSIGHAFTRITDQRWVSSLFQAEPASSYDIKVAFSGAGPLDNQVFEGITQRTRDYGEIELSSKLAMLSASYVISPDGTGTDCTDEAPCSWSTAFAALDSQQEIVFTEGTYFMGNINLKKTDTVLRGMDGHNVVIDGAFQQNSYEWTLVDGLDGVYSANIGSGLGDQYGVIADGQRMFPYECLDTGCELELVSLGMAGIDGFYCEGDVLYIKLAQSGVHPNDVLFEISEFQYAFLATHGTYVYNLEIQNYGNGQYGKGIYVNGVQRVVVKGCTFRHNNVGLGVKNEYDEMVVDGNTFVDTRAHWDWNAVKASNRALEGGGMTIYSSSTNNDGRGLVVKDNHFEGFFDCLVVASGAPWSLQTNEMVLLVAK